MCLLNFDVNKKVVVTHSHSRDDCIKINQNNLHLGMMKYPWRRRLPEGSFQESS